MTTVDLQLNLIVSHCLARPQKPLGTATCATDEVALKLLCWRGPRVPRGACEICAQIEAMLERAGSALIPVQGSVGASGDLAPLAHMAAVMIGEGEARYRGDDHAGPRPSRRPGCRRWCLAPKEGLALINGTQFSTACALVGLFGAWRAARGAVVTSALATDAIIGIDRAPLNPAIHAPARASGPDRRGHRHGRPARGQRDPDSHRDGDTRVQDPYLHPLPAAGHRGRHRPSALCGPHARDRGECRHRQSAGDRGDERDPVGRQFPCRTRGLRRPTRSRWPWPRSAPSRSACVALMVDPTLSFDLPPFLTPEPGLEFRPDDRRSHHRRPDEREQAPRQSLLHRQHADLRQPKRTMSAWPLTARGGWRE